MDTAPLVSVITPAKNAERWIAGAIQSVQAQTFTDWEMIVVDDGSTDGTLAHAHQVSDGDPRVRILRSEGTPGAGGARNAALAMARGRYIAFLDADDLWLPQKLETQIQAMDTNGWVFSWTSYQIEVIGDGNVPSPPPYTVRHAKEHASRWDILSKKAPIGCLTAVYDTAAFGKVPMTTIPKRQDFVLWAHLALEAEKKGWAMGGVTEVLATYRDRSGSLSANKGAAALMQWQALRQHCGVSIPEAVLLFSSYALRGLRDRFALHLQAR